MEAPNVGSQRILVRGSLMRFHGLYSPYKEESSFRFFFLGDRAEINFPNGKQVFLSVEKQTEFQEGDNSAKIFVDDPDGKVLEFSTKDATGRNTTVTLCKEGKCNTSGRVVVCGFDTNNE